MSKYIPGNQKHLTLEDRVYIENELAKGTSFKNIATFLCKDPTTISKEIRAHRLSDWYHKGTGGNTGTGKKSVEAVAKEVLAGKWGKTARKGRRGCRLIFLFLNVKTVIFFLCIVER